MKKCLIVGGGLAGLSAAVKLTQNNIPVKIIEASPKLGGRTYSFHFKRNSTTIDNGQHILMGCYENTLKYLDIIGAKDRIEFQEKFNIPFVTKEGREFNLSADSLFYPFSYILAILKFGALRIRDRFRLLYFFLYIGFKRANGNTDLSVDDIFKKSFQNDATKSVFLNILTESVFNSDINKISVDLFLSTFKKIFFTNSNSVKIITPKLGLSEVFVDKAELMIKMRGGEIRLSEKVEEIYEDGIKIIVKTNKQVYDDYDFIISAIPLDSLSKVYDLIEYKNIIKSNNTSSIITAHIWINDNPFKERFYALIDSKIHWLFNNKTHISIVISNADEFIEIPKEELAKLIVDELKEYFPVFYNPLIEDILVIKEKRATFIADDPFVKARENFNLDSSNFLVAGDWTNTGLPSTIESAINSGFKVANQIAESIKSDK